MRRLNFMQEKKFRIIQTAKITTQGSLTTKLNILKHQLIRLQENHPDQEFQIVDEQGNPAQLNDYLAADLANPVNKAKRKQAAKQAEYEATMKLKAKRF